MPGIDQFLADHLRLWKDAGVPAPQNELQSIQGWLRTLGLCGAEETAKRMRARMLLLMQNANALAEAGPEAAEAAGIYDQRPEMRPPGLEHEPLHACVVKDCWEEWHLSLHPTKAGAWRAGRDWLLERYNQAHESRRYCGKLPFDFMNRFQAFRVVPVMPRSGA